MVLFLSRHGPESAQKKVHFRDGDDGNGGFGSREAESGRIEGDGNGWDRIEGDGDG